MGSMRKNEWEKGRNVSWFAIFHIFEKYFHESIKTHEKYLMYVFAINIECSLMICKGS